MLEVKKKWLYRRTVTAHGIHPPTRLSYLCPKDLKPTEEVVDAMSPVPYYHICRGLAPPRGVPAHDWAQLGVQSGA